MRLRAQNCWLHPSSFSCDVNSVLCARFFCCCCCFSLPLRLEISTTTPAVHDAAGAIRCSQKERRCICKVRRIHPYRHRGTKTPFCSAFACFSWNLPTRTMPEPAVLRMEASVCLFFVIDLSVGCKSCNFYTHFFLNCSCAFICFFVQPSVLLPVCEYFNVAAHDVIHCTRKNVALTCSKLLS